MKRRIGILAVLAVVALAMAFVAGRSRQASTEGAGQRELAPGLKDGLNEVSTVRLVGAGGKPIATLVKNGASWTVREKDGYPADVDRLRKLLLAIADAKLLEEKTSLAGSYPMLGVEDVADEAAKGVRVELEGGKAPLQLIVGKVGDRGTYVRVAGAPQSWLVQGQIQVGRSTNDWMARDLVEIPAARIREVTIAGAGHTLKISKNAATDAHYAVADVPKGRALSSESAADPIAGTLARLRIDDARKGDSAAPGDAPITTARFVTFEGVVVTVTAWEADGRHFARFDASADGAPVAASQEAADLRARFAGWTFGIPKFTYDNLTRSPESLLKPK